MGSRAESQSRRVAESHERQNRNDTYTGKVAPAATVSLSGGPSRHRHGGSVDEGKSGRRDMVWIRPGVWRRGSDMGGISILRAEKVQLYAVLSSF
jgi:hypothetical protein